MGMKIHQPGQQRGAGQIDGHRTGRNRHLLHRADGGDLFAFHHDHPPRVNG